VSETAIETASGPRRGTPQVVVAIWVALCLGLAGMAEQLLPEKYVQDAHHIEHLALSATGPAADSFVTTAWVYKLFGGFAIPELTALVTFVLFLVVLFRCAPWLEISRFGPVELTLFCFCAVEAAIYIAPYSKESIVVLVVLTLTLVSTKPAGDVAFLTVVCLYAGFIRQYWFIIAALYVGMRLLLRMRRPMWIVAFIVLAVLVMAVGVSVVMHMNLNSFRQMVAQYNSAYAQTAIKDYIPVNGPVGGAANALLSLILLAAPIPLIITGSPVYLVFAALMIVLWLTLFTTVRDGMRQGLFRTDVRSARASALLLATLPTLAIFEPDYGSYLKHLTPLLPLFFLSLRARRAPRDRASPAGPPTFSDPATSSRGHTS
jgi:uncharacterized membrane protein